MFEAQLKDYIVTLSSSLGTEEVNVDSYNEPEAVERAQLIYRQNHSGYTDLYVVHVVEKTWNA